MLTLDEARRRILDAARPIEGVEEVPTQAAGGRVLAQAVVARIDVPPADNAQMDGYAVRCADVPQVPARLPVKLRIAAGQRAPSLPPGAAARIFTGAAIPSGCDAVVMQEATRPDGEDVVLLEAPVPGRWIRRRGSDIARGAEALRPGQALRAQHLGIAASLGAARLAVVRRPRVALFSSGDELATPGAALDAGADDGRIYNSNRYVLGGLLAALGCTVLDLGIVADRREEIRATLVRAAEEADLVVSTGGTSVGEEDHVRGVLAEIGQLGLWQIAMRPGKPLVFGRVAATPFIGLPGNPVSSFVTFVLLVRPFLLRLLGVAEVGPKAVPLLAEFDHCADPGRREFLRVRVAASGGLEPFSDQGSALLSSVAWADGLADIAPGASVRRGQPVAFLSFAELTGPP